MLGMMSESDARVNFIDPKLADRKWEPTHIIREYCLTKGRKLIANERGKRLFLDFLLKFNNTYLALIEAKKIDASPTKGLQQALGYVKKLQINYVYATNGKHIYEFDRQLRKREYFDRFRASYEIYRRLYGEKNKLKQLLQKIPFLLSRNFGARYFQVIAVNRRMESIAYGQNFIHLTFAARIDKTFIASQIVRKLLQGK